MATKTHGTAILTCKNHPTYRWIQTKYSQADADRNFIGAGVLMFDGEEGGKPASRWNKSESTLKQEGKETEEKYREHYTPECDCPVTDLVFLRWS